MIRLEKLKYVWTVVILYLFGLAASIFLTINSLFLFDWSIKFDQLSETVGMSGKLIKHNYLQLLSYLELPWINKLKMQSFNSSPHGLEHMREVKQLFLLNSVMLLVLIVLLFLTWRSLNRNQEWWKYYTVIKWSYLVPVVASSLILINFDQFFILFHKILFRNNYWIFDPSLDPVINILTDNFFMACFLMGLIYFELFIGLINWKIKRTLN